MLARSYNSATRSRPLHVTASHLPSVASLYVWCARGVSVMMRQCAMGHGHGVNRHRHESRAATNCHAAPCCSLLDEARSRIMYPLCSVVHTTTTRFTALVPRAVQPARTALRARLPAVAQRVAIRFHIVFASPLPRSPSSRLALRFAFGFAASAFPFVRARSALRPDRCPPAAPGPARVSARPAPPRRMRVCVTVGGPDRSKSSRHAVRDFT